jgi:hypothetical protein
VPQRIRYFPSVFIACTWRHLPALRAPAKLFSPVHRTNNLGSSMKTALALLLLASAAFATHAAYATTTDDVKWINQCVKDNKGDAADEVVLKYCTRMNNKMSDNETQSITQWEKTHVAERKACDKEAGWK